MSRIFAVLVLAICTLGEPQANSMEIVYEPQDFLLIQNREFLKALGVSAVEIDELHALITTGEAKLETIRKNWENSNDKKRSDLQKEYEDIRSRFLSKVRHLIAGRYERFKELRIQALGPAYCFTAPLAEQLAITDEQISEFQRATAEFEDTIYNSFWDRARNSDLDRQKEILRRIYNSKRASLNKAILAILTRSQHEEVKKMAGRRASFRIDLFQPTVMLRRLKIRFKRENTRLQMIEPYPIFDLITLASVRGVIRIKPNERLRLRQISDNWLQTVEEMYEKAEKLPREEQIFAIGDFYSKGQFEARKPFLNDIRGVLGPGRWKRINEIQCQLRGVGFVMGVELRKRFQIGKEQYQEMMTIVGEEGLQQEDLVSEDAATQEGLVQLVREANERRDKRLHECLNSRQKSIWKRMVGKPLENEHRLAIELEALEIQTVRLKQNNSSQD